MPATVSQPVHCRPVHRQHRQPRSGPRLLRKRLFSAPCSPAVALRQSGFQWPSRCHRPVWLSFKRLYRWHALTSAMRSWSKCLHPRASARPVLPELVSGQLPLQTPVLRRGRLCCPRSALRRLPTDCLPSAYRVRLQFGRCTIHSSIPERTHD